MVNRVATYPFTGSLISENMRLQARYADINTQISSGLKSQDYKGIARDSQYLLSVESTIDKLTAYNASANTALATVNTMYTTMNSIQDLANSMLSTVTAALGGNQVPASVLSSQANNALSEMAGLLNLRIAGRYAYSGSDIDTMPVNLADPGWVAQTPPSVVNTSYYQGNSTVNSVQVSETYTINYGVKADNAAFEQLFRAYNLVANNPSNNTALVEASGLIQQAIDAVANVQGVLSNHANSINGQVDKNEQDKSYLQELVSGIKETDIPSASVLLTEVQSQLEASYSASVRLLKLNLANYL